MADEFNEIFRLSFLIHDVARLQRVVQDRLLKPLGLTRSQWGVLIFLSRSDGMTQTVLADALDLTKPAIGGLLERMETSGIIERRPDESDARIRRVHLTSAGHGLLGQIREIVAPYGIRAAASNNRDEVASAIQVLRRLRESQLAMLEEVGLDPETK